MSDEISDVIGARSCGRCIYWKADAGECRYSPPCCSEPRWPTTKIDDWCFKWKSTATVVRQSAITTEIILTEIRDNIGLHPKQEWMTRQELINSISMNYSNPSTGVHQFSKPAIFSRLKTLVKYGVLGMGKYPPGVADEQPYDCVWILGKQNTEEPEVYVEDAPAGRPKLFVPDTIVNYLREKHTNPANRIGMRPLHRAISLISPMSMSTLQKLVAEGLEAGQIQRHDTGYWAGAKNSAPDSSDLGTMEVDA